MARLLPVVAPVGLLLAGAWAYLAYMDWGMRHMNAGMELWIMPRMVGWGAADLALVFLMWAVMMAAMMLPSALPVILLVARFNRAAAASRTPAWAFVSGYLLVWSGFSALAVLLQWGLLEAALLSPMMVSASPLLSAAILLGAGIYQFTPLKHACLRKCRSPLSILFGASGSGWVGALQMGTRHGAHCVGCCAALMCLLFVTGVMNLLWVLIVSVYVAIEKIAPGGDWLGRLTGALLIAWGAWLLSSALG